MGTTDEGDDARERMCAVSEENMEDFLQGMGNAGEVETGVAREDSVAPEAIERLPVL